VISNNEFNASEVNLQNSNVTQEYLDDSKMPVGSIHESHLPQSIIQENNIPDTSLQNSSMAPEELSDVISISNSDYLDDSKMPVGSIHESHLPQSIIQENDIPDTSLQNSSMAPEELSDVISSANSDYSISDYYTVTDTTGKVLIVPQPYYYTVTDTTETVSIVPQPHMKYCLEDIECRHIGEDYVCNRLRGDCIHQFGNCQENVDCTVRYGLLEEYALCESTGNMDERKVCVCRTKLCVENVESA